MRAAVYHGPADIRIDDVREPDPGPGEVLVSVAHNGICGTDLHEYFGGPQFIPTTPHPRTGFAMPVVMGHEFAGTVTEVAPDVTGLRVGDRVAVEPLRTCGHCVACTSGAYNACETVTVVGIAGGPGGLAEKVAVPADKAHKLPPGVGLELGALVEPMAVAHHAVSLAEPGPGTAAAVWGAGPIGLGAAFALRACGVEEILVVEPSATRRGIVSDLGFVPIDPVTDDVGERARTITDGRGLDLAVDCAGLTATFTSAVAVLRPRGTVVLVAMSPLPIEFVSSTLNLQEITVRGSHCYTGADYRAVIENMDRGAYTTTGWVQHVPLERLVTDGFEPLHRGEAMKILVDVEAR